MLDDRRFSPARGWRRVAVCLGIMTMIAGHLAWDAERRNAGLRDDVRWLRGRLSEKRELIAHQQDEMAAIAAAVDRLARTTSALDASAAEARRLARLDGSTVRQGDPGILTVAATLPGGALVSDQAGHALEELAWLDAEAANAGNTMEVLSAILHQRMDETRGSLPTLWPIHGAVTSPFGARTSPLGEGVEMHSGIDIQAAFGRPVTAAGSGQVVFAGRDGGYGGLVIIDHGNQMSSLYGHLSALYVREGQAVRRGQPIGAAGATGRATGTHVHYEVRVSGSPVDPRRFLN